MKITGLFLFCTKVKSVYITQVCGPVTFSFKDHCILFYFWANNKIAYIRLDLNLISCVFRFIFRKGVMI